MRLLKIFTYILIAVAFTTCQKKDLDIKLEETQCKRFKISEPTYAWISDPSCGGTSVNASLRVTFKYDGELDCIKKIVVSPKFYRSNNNEISGVTYNGSINSTDPVVTVSGMFVTFIFNFTFASTVDADAFNHIFIKFHTENDLGDKSNKLELRSNAGCSTVDPSTYNVSTTVPVTSSNVTIRLWDDAAEDGDIVSVYLNGVWVLENYTLTKNGENFNFTVNPGSNHLVLFAVNEGSTGPNTCALSVNGGSQVNLSPDLLTGEAVDIQF